MKRIIPLIIAFAIFAAVMLLGGAIYKKQRPVSYEGAVMVMTNGVIGACNADR